MINTIDHDAVCGHLKATLDGIITIDDIHQAVGRWNNLPPNLFAEKAKEVSTIFTRAMTGQFNFDPAEFQHVAIDLTVSTYLSPDGAEVAGVTFHDKEIDALLHMEPSPDTTKRWAGMTNLKSACVITSLSRQEKSDQCVAICHTVSIDPEVLSDWSTFVDEFTPVLLDGMEFGPRIYDPVWMIPESNKSTRTLDNKGRMVHVKQGEDAASDIYNQLRHPGINRLVRKWPKEAGAAILWGYEPVEASIGDRFPEPFNFEPPIMGIGVAPKLAQKARIVYIALSVAYSMSRPAFHRLNEIIDQWNMQGVMSHDKARTEVRDRLRANSRRKYPVPIHSYDQSSFTDNFSYEQIQRPIAVSLANHGVLIEFDVDVMDTINSGSMEAKALGRKHELLRFGTGTGMGVPYSFPLASIANGYMVAYSYWKAHGCYPINRRGKNPGKVTGDDCVIYDPATAANYEQLCDSIGLVINRSKSIVSETTAEFCGKFIRADGVYDKRKLMPLTSMDGLVDTLRYYKDKEEVYLEAFSDVLQIDPPGFVETLKAIPEPVGLGRPAVTRTREHGKTVIETVSLEDATPVEQFVVESAIASQLEAALPEASLGHRDDYQAAIRRKAKMDGLFVRDDPTPAKEEEVTRTEFRTLNGLQEALIRNALVIHQSMIASPDLETIYKSAAYVKEVFNSLTQDDPNFLDHFQKREAVLTQHRTSGEPSAEVKNLARLLGLSDSNGKEEDVNEHIQYPGS